MNTIIPNLMPFQLEPFNGDTFVQEAFLFLKNTYGIDTVIETGTCLGGTTLWLHENFDKVCTIESNHDFQKIAIERIAGSSKPNEPQRFIYFKSGDSGECLGECIKDMGATDKTIFFLDAHWEKSCPLLAELKHIADAGLKPIIVIHDFQVPDTKLSFDTYNGQPFNWDWISEHIVNIYGANFFPYFNNDIRSTGAKVGVLYITPTV